jgi:tryptophan aminotransferase
MLSMLAGKPNPSTFPFTHITLGVKTPPTPTVENDHHSSSSDSTAAATATTQTELVLKDDDLAMALQYNMTAGIPDLVSWVTDLMETVHCASHKTSSLSLPSSKKEGQQNSWRVSLGPGSQDLLYKAFCALLDPGDTIIVEGPTYP